MSKKTTKADELIDALCDERVLNKIIDKITNEVNSKLDLKFNQLITEMNDKLMTSIEKITEEKISKSINPIMKELSSVGERIDALEAISIQNDLIIVGLKSPIIDKEEDSANNQPKSETNKELQDLVLKHLRNDLEITISPNDINYVFKLNKNNNGVQKRSSIVVNLISSTKKYEIIRKAKFLRKNNNPFPTIFHNERLTRKNSDLFFKTRTLQRIKKIQATWIYKGEIFIRKETTSKPIKITHYKDLVSYE